MNSLKSPIRRISLFGLLVASIIVLYSTTALVGCSKTDLKEVPYTASSGTKQSMHSLVPGKGIATNSLVAVTPGEYASLNSEEQRLADQVQAAIDALFLFGENPDLENYETTINFVRDPSSPYNGIFFSPTDPNIPDPYKTHCAVCGVASAYSCIKTIKGYMDEHGLNDMDIHIRRFKNADGDNCVKISWGLQIAPPVLGDSTIVFDLP